MKMLIIIMLMAVCMVSVVYSSRISEPYEIIKTGAEANLDVSYEIINDRVTEFCIDYKNRDKYLTELRKRSTTKDIRGVSSIPVSIIEGRNVEISKANLDLSLGVLKWSYKDCFTVDARDKDFELKIGWNSIRIIPGGDTDGARTSASRNIIVLSDNNMLVAVRDGDDLMLGNSTDYFETYDYTEIITNDVNQIGITGSPDETVYIYYMNNTLSNEAIWHINSTDGGTTWNDAQMIISDTSYDIEYPSCAVDSNGLLHCCAAYQSTTDRLYYNNASSGTGGIYVEERIDDCTMEADISGNIYMMGSDSYNDQIVMWVSSEGFSSGLQHIVFEGFNFNPHYGISMVIEGSNIYMAFIEGGDLQFCNGTTSDLDTWSCQKLDSSSSINPSIGANQDGTIEIVYGVSTSGNYIFRTNSTDYGVTWDVRESLTISGMYYPGLADSTYPESNRMTNITHFISGHSYGTYYTNYSTYYVGDVLPDTSFTVTVPIGYDYPIFRAESNTSENIKPDGQTNDVPMFEVTNTGNQLLNFSMNLNSTVSDITLKADTDNTSEGANELTDTPIIIYTELDESESFGIWLWSDFNDAVIQETNRSMNLTADIS